MNNQQSIFLIGPSGAGKSTIGLEVAKQLDFDFYDSDQFVEERTGVSISWIFDVEGEEGFRQREISAIKELASLPSIVLATGGGAIVKPENRDVLAAKGLVVYLKTTLDQQLKRTRRKDHRPLLRVDDVKGRLEELNEARFPLYEEIADVMFNTAGKSVKAISAKIVHFLRERGY